MLLHEAGERRAVHVRLEGRRARVDLIESDLAGARRGQRGEAIARGRLNSGLKPSQIHLAIEFDSRAKHKLHQVVFMDIDRTALFGSAPRPCTVDTKRRRESKRRKHWG